MSLIKCYSVTETQMSKVPDSHGFDGFTRLYIKLSQLSQVVHVQAPKIDITGSDYRISGPEGDFIWIYRIERRIGVSWSEVDAAVAKAFGEFMSTCALSQ